MTTIDNSNLIFLREKADELIHSLQDDCPFASNILQELERLMEIIESGINKQGIANEHYSSLKTQTSHSIENTVQKIQQNDELMNAIKVLEHKIDNIEKHCEEMEESASVTKEKVSFIHVLD